MKFPEPRKAKTKDNYMTLWHMTWPEPLLQPVEVQLPMGPYAPVPVTSFGGKWGDEKGSLSLCISA